MLSAALGSPRGEGKQLGIEVTFGVLPAHLQLASLVLVDEHPACRCGFAAASPDLADRGSALGL